MTLKDIFATSNICDWAWFTNISKGKSDFAISRGFYSHETSTLWNFAKVKPSGKCPNLQYCSWITVVRASFLKCKHLMGMKQLLTLLSFSSWCLVIVVWLFLAVPRFFCSLWLWYFFIILTYYFGSLVDKTHHKSLPNSFQIFNVAYFCIYCKFGNICENFIFAYSVKIHTCFA